MFIYFNFSMTDFNFASVIVFVKLSFFKWLNKFSIFFQRKKNIDFIFINIFNIIVTVLKQERKDLDCSNIYSGSLAWLGQLIDINI